MVNILPVNIFIISLTDFLFICFCKIVDILTSQKSRPVLQCLSGHCTVHRAQCTVHSIQYTMHRAQSTVQCICVLEWRSCVRQRLCGAGVSWCSVVKCSAIQCSVFQCSAVQCSAVQYSAVPRLLAYLYGLLGKQGNNLFKCLLPTQSLFGVKQN